MSLYRVRDITSESILRIFFISHTVLFVGGHYKVTSQPSSEGLRGIRSSRIGGVPSVNCDNHAVFDVYVPNPEHPQVAKFLELCNPKVASLQTKLTMSNTTNQARLMPAPPYSADQLENYCLARYFSTRDKALTKEGMTADQAHDVGIEMMKAVPLYWFGQDKQLP